MSKALTPPAPPSPVLRREREGSSPLWQEAPGVAGGAVTTGPGEALSGPAVTYPHPRRGRRNSSYSHRTSSRQVRSLVLTSMTLSEPGSAPSARTFRWTARPPLTVHFLRSTFSHEASGTTRTRSEP